MANNLENYIKYESWKYCDKCHIVEPNKMLPNYGHQKMTPIRNCICSKGRYFVPMVCLAICFLLSYPIELTTPTPYLTSFFASFFSIWSSTITLPIIEQNKTNLLHFVN